MHCDSGCAKEFPAGIWTTRLVSPNGLMLQQYNNAYLAFEVEQAQRSPTSPAKSTYP